MGTHQKEIMSNPVQPPGPSPTDPSQSGVSQGQDPQEMTHFFPSMPMTKKEYTQFLNNEFKFFSQIVKHDMQRMKEANRKLRQASSGDG